MVNQQIAQYIAGFFKLPEEGIESNEVSRHFKHNFIVNMLDGITWLFGDSFASVSTILPVYVSTLTDSPIILGFIPALIDAGWFIPQLFMASYVERLPRKLPSVRFWGAMERLPFLGLAIGAIWLSNAPETTAIAILMLLVLWRGVTSGLVALPWQELVATVIPPSHRGRFFGLSNLLGQLVGVAGAAIAGWLLATQPYPRNYAITFLAGFILVSISWVFLSLTVEPPGLVNEAELQPTPSPLQDDIKRFRQIISGDGNFRFFLFSRMLSYVGRMAAGFLAVYAFKQFDLVDAQAAVFTGILFASAILGNGVWGVLGDMVGHKRILEISEFFWLMTLILAAIAPSIQIFYLVFAAMGLSRGAAIVGDLSIAMEFGPDEKRPTYIGMARTIPGSMMLFAPILGGSLIDFVGYKFMLMFAICFTSAGLALLWLRVDEPRNTHEKR